MTSVRPNAAVTNDPYITQVDGWADAWNAANRDDSYAVLAAVVEDTKDNEVLGAFAMLFFFADLIRKHRLDPAAIKLSTVSAWAAQLNDVRAMRASTSYLADSMRLAAAGNLTEAGRFFREGIQLGANHLAALRIAKQERDKNMGRARAGGAGRAREAAETYADRNAEILREAERMRNTRYEEHEVAGILANKFGLTPRRVRQILGGAKKRK